MDRCQKNVKSEEYFDSKYYVMLKTHNCINESSQGNKP
jgi:hypothetical protein